MKNVAAVIITYNVDDEFINRVKKVKNQAGEVIVVDNGSEKKTLEILRVVEKYATVMYLKENKGIAYALNRGIKYSIDKGYEWVLTLDHDSIVTDNMISTMLECYNGLEMDLKEKVAMLVPKHIEEKGFHEDLLKSSTSTSFYEEVLTEITSGALTKAEIYAKEGLYNEKLFIDLVDHDYCLALIRKGFKILQINSAILLHNLGESIRKNVLGLKITPTNHSPVRRYYMTRNRLYMWKKYKKDFPQWVLKDKRRFISETLKIILFEENKIMKLKHINIGIKDYKKHKFNKFNS